MDSRYRPIYFAIAAALCVATAAAAQSDIEGASDHPLVGRYDGSTITSYQVREYEEIVMPRAAFVRGDGDSPKAKSAALSGKLTTIVYEGPSGRSALEIVRNYQASLEADGFVTIYSCRRGECGYNADFWNIAKGSAGINGDWATNTYALLKLDRADGAVWASVFGVEVQYRDDPIKTELVLRVLEEKPIETGKISLVKADKLAEAIGIDGRIALYGIEFDHDSDIVKPASDLQIAEVAKYLKDNPSANVLVVGHTDTTGAFDYNRGLSERRAAAVVKKLTGGQGIGADRMFAVGVGPASPIATNRTEEGRARNRRVEIVELPAAD